MNRGVEPSKTPGIVWVFLAVVLLFDVILGWVLVQQIRIAEWPTTVATIEDSSLERGYSSSTSAIIRCPKITFSYEIDGKRWEADQMRYGGFCSSNWLDVDRISTELHATGSVTDPSDGSTGMRAYVRPERPEEAYLMAGVGPIDHLAFLATLPFNIFALGWILEILSLKITGQKFERQALRIVDSREDSGGRSIAYLPRVGPISFALGVLLVVSFFLALVAIFLFSVVPTHFYGAIWAALGSLALVSAVGKFLWNRIRARRVVYDRQSNRLLLPDGTLLAGDRIQDWTVDESRAEGSDLQRPSDFRLSVLYDDPAGESQQAVVAVLSGHETTYRLIDWLVQQLGLSTDRT